MSEPHMITWTLEPESITGKVTCSAEPGAPCRMACPRECEYACSHTKTDSGECVTLPWLENSDLLETYAGEPTEVRDGWIGTTWTGEYVEWRYAEPATPSQEEGPR